MGRKILHLAIENICLELEIFRNPHLKKSPFVLAIPSDRSVVQAVSSRATDYGIHPGMPLSVARKRCRSLVTIPPDTSYYHSCQKKIFHQLMSFSPLAEISSWGRFYIDLTGTKRLLGDPVDVAYRSQKLLKKLVGLEARAGIGTNKLVSRVAATLIPPLDVCEVFSGSESRFMAPLDPQILPGIGSVTRKRLQELNITSLGKLANIPGETLKAVLGPPATHLCELALGKGETKVHTPVSVPRICIKWPLPEESNNREILLAHIMTLSEKLGYQLRKENRIPYRISLELVYSDSVRARGQKTVSEAFLYLDHFIFMTLKEIFGRICKRRVRIKELIVRAEKFSVPFRQLSLFLCDEQIYEKEEKLTDALDTIRNRYGFNSIFRGSTFNILRTTLH